jgi:methionyl-tRNA synthetase
VPRYLVTSALPYANGPIHFGHVAGAYLPADVYVRYLRMRGEEVRYVCGTDEHGAAITIGAEKEGRSYADYVAGWRESIKHTLDSFGIEFDIWSGTSICPQHARFSQEFFRRLDENGYLIQQTTEQLYCESDEMFLPDRYVLGTCPNCGHTPARGDECPACGNWLDPLKLLEPRCKACDSTPIVRATTHWYLDLPKLRDEHIAGWFEGKEWKANVGAFVARMLTDLRPRPITRDMKWGVPVPADLAGEHQGKVLYVWFDAPIGYVSMTAELAERNGEPEEWRRWWQSPDTRLVHFVGKDNIPFHALVFPSMLWGVKQEYVLPWAVPANEFYNLQGAKFSTSENRTIPITEFFEKYDPDAARFHLVASMPENSDSEFRWEEFQSTVNASLADTIGNLVTRVLRFIDKHFEGRVPELAPELAKEMDEILLGQCGPIADPGACLANFRFRRAAEEFVANAAAANVFVDRLAPWALRKSDPPRASAALATLCDWLALLARWMVPFMPRKAQELWSMLGQAGAVAGEPWPELPVAGAWRILAPGQVLGTVAGLFAKIDDEQVAREISELVGRADPPIDGRPESDSQA